MLRHSRAIDIKILHNLVKHLLLIKYTIIMKVLHAHSQAALHHLSCKSVYVYGPF